MRSVDTNVLARWLLEDDPAQTLIADKILSEPVHIANSVLVELGWVLSSKRNLSRETVVRLLSTLLDFANVNFTDSNAIAWALERFSEGADWADMVHLVDCSGVATEFFTFDRKLAKQAGASTPVQIHTIKSPE